MTREARSRETIVRAFREERRTTKRGEIGRRRIGLQVFQRRQSREEDEEEEEEEGGEGGGKLPARKRVSARKVWLQPLDGGTVHPPPPTAPRAVAVSTPVPSRGVRVTP